MSNNEPSYYIVIPGFVRSNTTISPSAKLLYGEIASKCNVKGFCWATNKFLADLMGCNIRSIQRYITELQSENLIKIDLQKGDDGTLRNIFLTTDLSQAGMTGLSTPSDFPVNPGGDTAVTHNKLSKEHSNLKNKTPFNSNELKGSAKQKLSPKKTKAGKRSQDAGAKNPPTLYQRFIEAYHNWYLKNEGIPPKIDGAAGNAGKSLIGYFEKIVKSKAATDKKEYSEEQFQNVVIEAWQLVLDNWKSLEPFYQGKIRLIDINSNIQNIIKQVKDGKQGNNGKPATGGNVSNDNLANTIAKHYANNGGGEQQPGGQATGKT